MNARCQIQADFVNVTGVIFIQFKSIAYLLDNSPNVFDGKQAMMIPMSSGKMRRILSYFCYTNLYQITCLLILRFQDYLNNDRPCLRTHPPDGDLQEEAIYRLYSSWLTNPGRGEELFY